MDSAASIPEFRSPKGENFEPARRGVVAAGAANPVAPVGGVGASGQDRQGANAAAAMLPHAATHSDRRIVSLAYQPFDFGWEQPAEASALAATITVGALDLRRVLVFGPGRVRLTDRNWPIRLDKPKREGGLPTVGP